MQIACSFVIIAGVEFFSVYWFTLIPLFLYSVFVYETKRAYCVIILASFAYQLPFTLGIHPFYNFLIYQPMLTIGLFAVSLLILWEGKHIYLAIFGILFAFSWQLYTYHCSIQQYAIPMCKFLTLAYLLYIFYRNCYQTTRLDPEYNSTKADEILIQPSYRKRNKR
jgi:hypothetical protein